jgi:CRP/FNR family cyclic AMP-dependent transcriptional regulator
MTRPAQDDPQRPASSLAREFAAGEVLFSTGEAATEAFLLQSGRIRLIKRVSGVDRSLRLLTSGDLFGESALIPGATRTCTAVAVEAGRALTLAPSAVQDVLTRDPAAGSRVLEQLARRLRDAEDQIEVLMVRDGQAKVVMTLLKLARQVIGVQGLPDGAVPLAITPVDLATRAGLDVETVKRNVQQLRESHYVRIADERIEIPDVSALQELLDLLGIKQHLAGDNPSRDSR